MHIWEGRPCFLSTAHTEADVRFIVDAFKESVCEMQAGGFLPGEPSVVSGAHGTNGHTESGKKGPDQTPHVVRANASLAVSQDVVRHDAKAVQFSLYYFGNYPARLFRGQIPSDSGERQVRGRKPIHGGLVAGTAFSFGRRVFAKFVGN